MTVVSSSAGWFPPGVEFAAGDGVRTAVDTVTVGALIELAGTPRAAEKAPTRTELAPRPAAGSPPPAVGSVRREEMRAEADEEARTRTVICAPAVGGCTADELLIGSPAMAVIQAVSDYFGRSGKEQRIRIDTSSTFLARSSHPQAMGKQREAKCLQRQRTGTNSGGSSSSAAGVALMPRVVVVAQPCTHCRLLALTGQIHWPTLACKTVRAKI